MTGEITLRGGCGWPVAASRKKCLRLTGPGIKTHLGCPRGTVRTLKKYPAKCKRAFRFTYQ